MVFVSQLSRFLIRNVRSSIRTSVRRYDAETGGEEMKSTTVSILSKEDDDFLYVEAYSQMGFRLSNGFRIMGPCVLFPRSILHWGIGGTHDLSEDSLALFPMLEPKLDILILGIGDHGAKYDKSIMRYLRANKINVEILPTDQACSTFNFLNAERRVVAAGLIPPTYMLLEDDDDDPFRKQLELHGDAMFNTKFGFSEDPIANVRGEFSPLLDKMKEQVSNVGLEQKQPAKEEQKQPAKDGEGESRREEGPADKGS